MTRGIVCFIGAKSRELELFSVRLEREHYGVVSLASPARFSGWLRKETPQAVLISARLSQSNIEQVARTLRLKYPTRRIPLIVVANDEVPNSLLGIKGVGEAFCLHRISLREALDRLTLAIQLTQISRV